MKTKRKSLSRGATKLNQKIEKYQCPHLPKVAKKIGMLAGCQAEIFVCESCKDDPDLEEFSEVMVQ